MSIAPGPRPDAVAGSPGSRTLTCFISAPPHVDVGAIRRLLAERDIVATVPHEAVELGTSIVDGVTALIDACDLFVAVLDDAQHGANVAFELGYAFARGKKILALVSPRYDAVPSDLSRMLYIRAESGDVDAIGFGLDQLLRAPGQLRRSHGVVVPAGRPIGDRTHELQGHLSVAIRERDMVGLEAVVSEALRASGVSVIVSAEQPDLGADLAVWSDGLDPWVGNPLLIELKLTIASVTAARIVAEQVTSYVRASGTGWALVLYADGPSTEALTSLSRPPVLFLALTDLFDQLHSRSFDQIVQELRNRVIHGR